MTDTSRLDALEMRIAHQDETIEELNAAVTAQWKLIDRLARQVEDASFKDDLEAELVSTAHAVAGELHDKDRAKSVTVTFPDGGAVTQYELN